MFRIASDYARSARPQTKRKIQRRTPKIYCSSRRVRGKNRQARIIVVPCGDASGGQALRRVELGGEFLVAETGIKRAKIKRRRSAGKNDFKFKNCLTVLIIAYSGIIMKYIPHISLPFLAPFFISLSAAAETYYYWGDAANGSMPVFGASAWSSSASEYAAIPEDTNVNSPDANWVFDYDAHLPVAHRREGIYFNIIDQPFINIASLSVLNYNYTAIDYVSGDSVVSGGDAKTLFISNTEGAYWSIGEFTFTGGSSDRVLVFGSASVNSNQPEVTLGTVNIGSEDAYANIQFGGDAAGVCKMTAGDNIGQDTTMMESACMKYLTVTGDFNIYGNSVVSFNVWNEDTSVVHSENMPDIAIDGVVRMTPSSDGKLPTLNLLNRVGTVSWHSAKPAPGATNTFIKIGGLDGRGNLSNNSCTLDASAVKLIFTNKEDCDFSGTFTENRSDSIKTVMSVKMAGENGKKQIIHADAQFSGTVEVESGTLIMKSSTALGKLTMRGGAFGGIDGGVKVSGADWYGGDIILYSADTLNGGIADKITVDGKLSKLGDGPIGVDFNGYEVLSENIDNEEFFYELLTATEREGFSDDANEDFYAKNLENCFANFEWVGNTLTVSFASVPEPAAVAALIGAFALGVAAWRRRR